MELKGSTALVLGGGGLVGMAVARRLLALRPARLIVTALTRAEAEEASRELAAEAVGSPVEPAWGNIFLPADLAEERLATLLAHPETRRRLVDDTLRPASPEAFRGNLLFGWLLKYQPDVVVDCINTATSLAYQDVFTSSSRLLRAVEDGAVSVEAVERHLLTQPTPQLIRHLEIAFEGMRQARTRAYVKIGTSGTGGMGLNIPYTHSEERPSRTLMTKSAVAGAHTLLLFLLGRTPGAPAIIEIKPTAAIAWREIGYGVIKRGGRTLDLVDCETPIPLADAFTQDAQGWSYTGEPLQSVFINVGENGLFARDEFETVSALGQMELVTPEEIADVVILELCGRPTGRDIIGALDAATFGPTYRGGYLRAVAVQELKALEVARGVRSIAFETLGPPRLTKLLYESHILSRLRDSVRSLAASDADVISEEAERLLRDRDHGLRRQILTVGLPILLRDGESILRGETVVVLPDARGVETAHRGWVDLRPSNIAQWIRRAESIASAPAEKGTGSGARWTAIEPDLPIEPARMAVWVFQEEGGYRIKR